MVKIELGALYRNLWSTDYGYIDHEGKPGKCMIEVQLPNKGIIGNGGKSNIIITSVNKDNNMLDGFVDLGWSDELPGCVHGAFDGVDGGVHP